MTTFELIFTDEFQNQQVIELENEPVGYDGSSFTLQREENRHGIDILFMADADYSLEFIEEFHYEVFGKLVEYYENYGFEANVKLRVTDNGETFVGNLGFDSMEYNGYDSIKINVFQETEQALIKKRSSTKIDLFGNKDLDGNTSAPANHTKVLLKSKELFLTSVWENLQGTQFITSNLEMGIGFNKSVNSTKYEIQSSIYAGNIWTGVTAVPESEAWKYRKDFKLIDSKTSLTNVKISVKFNGSRFAKNSQGNEQFLDLKYRVGIDPHDRPSFENSIQSIRIQTTQNPTFPNIRELIDLEFTIPEIANDQSLWLWFQPGVWAPESVIYENVVISVEVNSTAFDTTTKAVSIYDAINKVSRDICGMPVNFPIAQTGRLKNNYIFNGDHVRGIDSEFKLSFDEIKEWLPEMNLDYEIQSNNTIYIGGFNDFFTDTEIRVYDNVAFDTFSITTNLDFTINEFVYEYQEYQAQNENTEEGSKETIHGKAVYLINNKQVESRKEVSVSFARDSFSLEKKRRDAITEKDNTSASSDDTVFILDSVPLPSLERYITKTSFLYHTLGTHEGESVLIIKNDGSFRFDLLGLQEIPIVWPPSTTYSANFTFINTTNNGHYYVRKVDRYEIILKKQTGSVNGINEVFSEFVYRVSDGVVFKPKIDTIHHITGITSPSTFVNTDWSVRSNITNYYLDYLKTANLFKNEKVKLTDYKHNKLFYKQNASIQFNVLEGEDIETSKDPILDCKKVQTKLIMTLSEYFSLCNTLRSGNRGLIRTYSPLKVPLYIYIDQMDSIRKSSDLEEVDVSGKLRFIPNEINIKKSNGIYRIFIHDVAQKKYEITEDYVQFYDDNDFPIYKRVHFSKVKLNDVSYSSVENFITALENF